MRILFVGMSNSIHTTRWINQISNQGWDIYLFPVMVNQSHPDLENIKIFCSYFPNKKTRRNNKIFWWTIPFFIIETFMTKYLHKQNYQIISKILTIIISCLKPDMIHSLEIQHAGYLTFEAHELYKKPFPSWIITNWGSDIYLFGRLSEHKKKIKRILSLCDYYSCECSRDIQLAYNLGFRGKVLPVFPNTGGFNLKKIRTQNYLKPPSIRKKILLKGYQHWAGRALFGLQSLRYCSDLLQNYTISISLSSIDVRIAAELFSQDTGIEIELVSEISHDEMLQYFGQSRIYIGLSISDGISTSLLEAMAMGAFPIQSFTSCADEWIMDGQTGFLVPPEDPLEISKRIRLALKNDNLVDRAALINLQTAQKRLDYDLIKQKVVKMYQQILAEIKEKS